jgi:MscS family membrane protein
MNGRPDWLPDWVAAPQWAIDAWNEIARVWSMGVFGMTYGQIFAAVGILLLALLLRGFIARTIIRWITRAAAGTKTNLDDALVKAISEPLKLLPLIFGVYAAMSILNVTPEWHAVADKVMQSLVALAVFWTLNRAVAAFSFLLGAYKNTLGWLIRTLEILFLAMGVAAVLQIWSVPILPVLGGLGIFGVALAFGAQDLVKNVISGIFILIEKRLTPGEWIVVPDVVEGIVEEIGFRSIIVRQFDKTPVYVPNAVFSDNTVKNYSRMSHRRIKWVIGLEYRSSVPQLKYVRDEIEAYIWTSEDFAKPPEAGLMVYIDGLNESSIDILVYCFTHATAWDAWMAAKERLAVKIMEIVKAAGTDFAFPSRTLYMQQVDAPEPFTPPAPSPAVAEAAKLREGRRTEMLSGGGKVDDDGE